MMRNTFHVRAMTAGCAPIVCLAVWTALKSL